MKINLFRVKDENKTVTTTKNKHTNKKNASKIGKL